MAISTRTAVAVHALTFLDHWQADGLQSSDRIAESLDSNPALVRRVLGLLREHGLVSATEGSGGGWRLARPGDRITLFDAYAAVERDTTVLPTHAHPPNQRCVIGRHMQSLLEEEFTVAQRAMEARLAATSIREVLLRVRRRDSASPTRG